MRWGTAVVLLIVWLSLAVPASGRSLATLPLQATFSASVSGVNCPSGTPSTTDCFSAQATGPVPGLGTVTETFEEMIAGATSCMHTTFGPAVLAVAGKGQLDASLTDSNTCDPDFTVTVSDPFTITGGTGPYAGATGSGTLTFSNFASTGPSSARETHTWTGQIAAATAFDTTAPTINGARSLTVRTKKHNVRVHYAVTATDAVDGTVAVACSPKSGSRFKIGRTRVTCSATDSSDNTATARFTVTVKRRR